MKTNLDKEIDAVHHHLRWNPNYYGDQCSNIIERVLFSPSDLTVGVQIADLYCYPIFHVHEYGDEAYWRYQETVIPKFHSAK